MNDLILFLIVAFITVIIGTIAGFGTSIILLPIALLFVDFKTALVLVAITHLSGNAGATTFFRHGLDKGLFLLFGIPSVILTIIGAYLVIYVPQNILQIILGIFLSIFSVYSLINPDFKVSASKNKTILGGGLSGFLQGLIGVGGPLRGAFLISYNLDKFKYIATLAAIAVIVDATRIPVYLLDNLLEPQFYFYIPPLIIISIVGSYAGKMIVNKIPQRTLKKFVLVGISLASVLLIYGGLKLVMR